MFLRCLSWCLPPLILWVVFSRIDVDRLLSLLAGADGRLAVVAALCSPLIACAGAARWQSLMRRFALEPWPWIRTLVDYWKGLAIGVLAPGSLGSDAFRALLMGRPQGLYWRAVVILLLEKAGALAACVLLLALLFPMMAPQGLPGVQLQPRTVLLLTLIGLISAAVMAVVVRRHHGGARLVRGLTERIERSVQRIVRQGGAPSGRASLDASGRSALIARALGPAVLLPAVAWSLLALALSAVQAHLFFRALGTPVPFGVNLLVTPLLFIAFALPISVAGIGVREAGFVVCYGAFGIGAEPALAASLCCLASLLTSLAFGALLFARSRRATLASLGIGP